MLDYNLNFRVVFGVFAQTCDGTLNDTSPRSTDALELGPNSNFQGGINCFNLSTGKILQRQWQDAEAHKISFSFVRRVNSIYKQ